MSNTNSLRFSLANRQDTVQHYREAGLDPRAYNRAVDNGPSYALLKEGASRRLKTPEDRRRLRDAVLTSDLAATTYEGVLVAQYGAVEAEVIKGFRKSRSSEAGERERQAQAQHSRTFHADEKERYYQNTGSLDGYEEPQDSGYGSSLAWEVAQQEADFGPEVEEEHEHTCRHCSQGVTCTGEGDGCFDGYCSDCRSNLDAGRPYCIDCGAWGETVGHPTCQYPQDHDNR